MKKVYFTSLLATGALLTSCMNDSTTASAPDNEIAYGVSTRNISRVAVSYGKNSLPKAFKVWAVTPGAATPYINGHTVTNTTSGWVDDNGTQYWPTSNLNFYATVNDGDCFQFNNGSPQIKDFKVKASVDEQVDLLYATAFDQSSQNKTVNFKFQHALAQVGFKAQCKNSKLNVEINSVSLNKIGNVATFTYPTSTTDVAVWSAPTGEASYSVTFSSPIAVGADVTDLTCGDVSTVMSLIPQTVSAWNPKGSTTFDGAYFLVDCKITDNETQAVLRNGEIAIPVDVKLSAGNRYIYTFTFSSHLGGYTPDPTNPEPVLVPINYTVSVDDFVTVPDENIPIEDNTSTASDENLVGAEFSVNGKKFRFTSGNLQYNATESKWLLAERQTDIICASGSNQSPIDLYCWGATGIGSAQRPVTTNLSASSYPSATDNIFTSGNILNTDYDWGKAYGTQEGENGYFTLTADDWSSLISNYVVSAATIEKVPDADNPSKTASHMGLIILPLTDDKEIKSKIENIGGGFYSNNYSRFTLSTSSINSSSFQAIYLTLEQLSALNAVFLPVVTIADNVTGCYYWTSSCGYNSNIATALQLTTGTIKFTLNTDAQRNSAYAVRLAKQIP